MLEGNVFELLEGIIQLDRSSEKTPPRWLTRVKDRLHAEFHDHLSMCDLAQQAGIHPVHLARAFRKFQRCTPGEYQQRLQLRAACELLRNPDRPLAEIAADCGYSDQSHLTRKFRKFAATTPSEFRRTIARSTA